MHSGTHMGTMSHDTTCIICKFSSSVSGVGSIGGRVGLARSCDTTCIICKFNSSVSGVGSIGGRVGLARSCDATCVICKFSSSVRVVWEVLEGGWGWLGYVTSSTTGDGVWQCC